VTTAVARGVLSRKALEGVLDEPLPLKETIESAVVSLHAFTTERAHVARRQALDGKLAVRVNVPMIADMWKSLIGNGNSVANGPATRIPGVAEVTTAVARDGLSRKLVVHAGDRILGFKAAINTIVDQVRAFASKVTGLAHATHVPHAVRRIGTEGNPGGQRNVPGIAGILKGHTDRIDLTASNLDAQVCSNHALAMIAAASGHPSKVTDLQEDRPDHVSPVKSDWTARVRRVAGAPVAAGKGDRLQETIAG
jgi:hypothetical protein